MTYPSKYEYDDVTMLAMKNAIIDFFADKLDSVGFYKMDDYKNFAGKIDGTAYLTINNGYDLNLQIKRSDIHPDSFSVGGNALRSYIGQDLNIQALLVGLANRENMYLFHWSHFVDYIQENHTHLKSKYGDYYVIDIDILLSDLYYRKIPYTDNDYKKLQTVWNNARKNYG